MVRRWFISGGETPDWFPWTEPTVAWITRQTAVKRSGDFAFKIAAPATSDSGVLAVNYNYLSNPRVEYVRFYLYVERLPSVARRFFRKGATNSLGFPSLILDATGNILLSHGAGTTILATSTSRVPLNRWVRVEMGFFYDGNLVEVRVNDTTVIDWTFAPSQSLLSNTILQFGGIDLSSEAMTFHLDDLAIDSEEYPRHGRIVRCDPDSVLVDSANWTAQGGASDKVDAIDCSSGLNDNTYLLGPSAAGSILVFGHPSEPPQARAIRAFMPRVRTMRNPALSSGTSQMSIGQGGPIAYAAYENRALPSQVAWTWWELSSGFASVGARTSDWSKDDFANAGSLIRSGNTVAAAVSAVAAELEYDESAGAITRPRRCLTAGFEWDGVPDILAANSTTSQSGSWERSTARAYSGNASLRIDAQEHIGVALASTHSAFAGTGSTTATRVIRVMLYVESLPTSGSADLVYCVAGVTTHVALRLNGAGELLLYSTGLTLRATVAGSVTTGRWHCVELWTQISSSSSNNDGRLMLRVDDLVVADVSNILVNLTTFNTASWRFGNNQAGASGFAYHLDDIICDESNWIGRNPRLVVVDVDADGQFNPNTWTRVGASADWEAVVSDDDDTSYLESPSTAYTSVKAGVIPGFVRMIRNVVLLIKLKSSANTTAQRFGYRLLGANSIRSSGRNTANITSASYGAKTLNYNQTGANGMWTPAKFNAMDIEVGFVSTTGQPVRWGHASSLVEYLPYLEDEGVGVSQGQIVG